MAEELLGWAVAAGVVYGAYKLIFGSSSARRTISQDSIDQITSVFPHVTAAAARWELERNGGSVERAVERALREGGLPEPPASYFPPPPTGAPLPPTTPRAATPTPVGGGAPTTPHGASSSSTAGPPPSLIKRMGLQGRAAVEDHGKGKGKGKGKEVEEDEGAGTRVGWSPSAAERERNLRARKERLVLEARRKLMEKERARKEAAAAEGGEPSSPSS
ncbi:hypothetical protein JCM6882_008475 [Rhodosporidiobolus microsporus]